jgi:hypothetical protein
MRSIQCIFLNQWPKQPSGIKTKAPRIFFFVGCVIREIYHSFVKGYNKKSFKLVAMDTPNTFTSETPRQNPPLADSGHTACALTIGLKTNALTLNMTF